MSPGSHSRKLSLTRASGPKRLQLPHAGFLGIFVEWPLVAFEGACAMLRKTMIVLATAAALTGGLTADALARGGGGGGGHGGGGGGHGGGFGGRGHFARAGHFRHRRGFGGGFYNYNYACSYPYYTDYCDYLPE